MPPRKRSPVAHVLADVGRALGRLGIDWYLFGAQAATLRGLRRTTVDVDVTAVGEALDGNVLVGALRRTFALRVPDAEEFIRATRVLPMSHRATGMDLDLVLGGPGLESWFLARSERISIEGVELRVPLLADLVVMKLIAGRPRDLDDVVELVTFDPTGIDLGDVRQTLGELETAIGEAGLLAALDAVETRLRVPARTASKPAMPKRRK